MFNMTAETLTSAAQMISSDIRISVYPGKPMTDGRRIWLPGIKDNLTGDDLAILRGYFLHEASHIIYKSFDNKIKDVDMSQFPNLPRGAVWSIFNAVEDTRIEARCKADYPGAVGPLAAMSEANLAENNKSKPEIGDFLAATHAIIWYIQDEYDRATYCDNGKNLLELCGSPLFGLLNIWDSKLRDDRLNHLGADDAAMLAVEIAKVMNAAIAASTPDQPDQPDQPGEPGESGESGESGDDQPEPSGEPGDGQPGQPGQPGEGTGDTTAPSIKDEVIDLSSPVFVPEVFDMEKNVRGEECYEVASFVNANRMMRNRPLNADSTMGSKYHQIHSDAMKIVQRLRDELQANDTVHWSRPRESGHRIDRRRISGVASGTTTRAFNRRRVGEAHKSFVTIALDMSSSMRPIAEAASSVAYMVADACESTGVPCGITSFNTASHVSKAPGTPVNPGVQFDCKPRGCTDMLPSIVQHSVWANEHPTRQPVLFIVSDGQTEHRDVCAKSVRDMAMSGHRVYGIAIGEMDSVVREAIIKHGEGVVSLSTNVTADQLAAAFTAGLATI